MNFSDFIHKINSPEELILGGVEAQFLLAPKQRLKYNEQKIAANNPRKAAVMALFYPDEFHKTRLLLTQRATYKGVHSAQISFPGGKFEPKDDNLLQTALRETFEEVGVFPNKIKVFKEMTSVYIPPSNFLATPFMGYLSQKPSLNLNHEVAKTIEILLSDLLDDQNISSTILSNSYLSNVAVPCFKIQDAIIWGATAMMLSEIRMLFK